MGGENTVPETRNQNVKRRLKSATIVITSCVFMGMNQILIRVVLSCIFSNLKKSVYSIVEL